MRSFLQIKPYLKTQRDTKDESRVAGWGAWGGGVQGREGKSSPSPSPSPPHHQLSCAGRALCRTQFGNHCLKKRQITKYLSFQNHKLWMYDWTDVNGYLSNLSGTISLSLPLLVPGFCAYYCMLFLPVSSAFQILPLLQGSAQNLPLLQSLFLVFPVGCNFTFLWGPIVVLHLIYIN